MRINITNCYCLFLTIMMIITLTLSMNRIELLHDRCDYLENKIDAIKNEAELTDCNQLIQLHQDNK